MASGLFSGLGKVLNASAAYLQHVGFANKAVAAPATALPVLLAQYTQGLSDASFNGFKVTLGMLVANETDGTRKAALYRLLQDADAARRGERLVVHAPTSAAPSPAPADGSDFDRDLALFSHWFDDLDDASRKCALVDHVSALSPDSYKRWIANLAQMNANIAERIRQHEASEASAWGRFSEDRTAYLMARLRTGQRDPAFMRQLATYQNVQSFMERLLQASEQVWRECQQEKERPVVPITSAASVKAAIQEMRRSGHYPGGAGQLQKDVMTLVQSGDADEVRAMLEAMGADEGNSKLLSIADYYRPGPGLYQLCWPIDFALPIPFVQLDRPTQFSVLFGEWSRRELEGSYARNAGDCGAAMAIFEECLARAEQIDVAELIARSHEDLASVANKLNQRADERKHLRLAIAARKSA